MVHSRDALIPVQDNPTVAAERRGWGAIDVWEPARLQARILANIEPDTNGGCWLWTGTLHQNGYGEMGIGQRLHNRAHRVSFSVFRGAIPEGALVLHRCDVRACCNPSHLFLGSSTDNVRDMISKGRVRYKPVRGSENTNARLTDAQVVEIRTSPESSYALAERLPVTASMVRRIRRGQAWASVPAAVSPNLKAKAQGEGG